MPDVCKECQRLLDISNSFQLEPKDEFEPDDIKTWNESVLTATDESIDRSIKSTNAIINHFEKCDDLGCKELMENWKPYKLETNRKSMLS